MEWLKKKGYHEISSLIAVQLDAEHHYANYSLNFITTF